MVSILLFCILLVLCPAIIGIFLILFQVFYYLILFGMGVCLVVGAIVYFPKTTITYALGYWLYEFLKKKWRGVRESNSRAIG